MDHPVLSPKVLLAPLDWGLGHATRCIPIIKHLLNQNCYVFLAGSGRVKALLQTEFPLLPFVDLPGYNIQYASSAWALPFKIVAQIPKLIFAINNEQAWVRKVVKDQEIDIIISDNRYGLYHYGITSVFITHQLTIKAPFNGIEKLVQKLAYQSINKFTVCWVPDEEGTNNLADNLSHPKQKPLIPVRYTGPLSRFNSIPAVGEKAQLLILLSGPEPQRTLLEESLLAELKDYKEPVLLIRGLPGISKTIAAAKNITIVNHMPAYELEQQLKESFMVISRCGYSTVMDLAILKKRSILIPTPGQTEQEYLAKHLMKKNFALCIDQKKFRLKAALELAAGFKYQPFEASANQLETVIASLVEQVKAKKQIPNS